MIFIILSNAVSDSDCLKAELLKVEVDTHEKNITMIPNRMSFKTRIELIIQELEKSTSPESYSDLLYYLMYLLSNFF
jgi:hypothetical protein